MDRRERLQRKERQKVRCTTAKNGTGQIIKRRGRPDTGHKEMIVECVAKKETTATTIMEGLCPCKRGKSVHDRNQRTEQRGGKQRKVQGSRWIHVGNGVTDSAAHVHAYYQTMNSLLCRHVCMTATRPAADRACMSLKPIIMGDSLQAGHRRCEVSAICCLGPRALAWSERATSK
jgi:hypothetical protein